MPRLFAQTRLPLIISILLFGVGLFWFSRGIDFPPFYHPDEINKVAQVQNGDRNFNHPQLMLNSAAALYTLAGAPKSITETAAITRWISVFFMAATIAILAYLAALLAGPLAQLCCGWLLLTTPKLFELAHYLKEDPALTLGFAATYLAMFFYAREKSTTTAAWLGVAGGLALSAKYIGVFALALALIILLILIWKQPYRWRHLGWFLGGCLVVVVIFNWQAFVRSDRFQAGLTGEIKLFDKETASLINPRILDSLGEEIGWLAWAGLVVWLLSPVIRRKKLSATEWMILICTFGYAGMLMFSSRAASRYLMPTIVSLPLVISVAACWLGAMAAHRLRLPAWALQSAACLAIIVPITAQKAPSLERLYTGFHGDTRFELVDFIRAQLPAGAVIAEDEQVRLPTAANSRRTVEGKNLPNTRIYPEKADYLGEEFTLEQLKAKGATHVVVFVDRPTANALKTAQKDTSQPSMNRLATFIGDLEKTATLMWSTEGRTPLYLNPGMRLYDLTKSPAATN